MFGTLGRLGYEGGGGCYKEKVLEDYEGDLEAGYGGKEIKAGAGKATVVVAAGLAQEGCAAQTPIPAALPPLLGSVCDKPISRILRILSCQLGGPSGTTHPPSVEQWPQFTQMVGGYKLVSLWARRLLRTRVRSLLVLHCLPGQVSLAFRNPS